MSVLVVALFAAAGCASTSRTDAALEGGTGDGAGSEAGDGGAVDDAMDGSSPCSDAGRGEPGSACECDDDCTLGDRCIPQSAGGLPRGTCVRACEAAQPPPAGFVCVGTQPGTYGLAQACGDGLPPCRPGWSCTLRGSNRYCTPQCDATEHCSGGVSCDRYTGLCTTPAATGGVVGDPCVRNEDCRSGTCVTVYPGGFCRSTCNIATGNCADNGVCVVPSPDGGVTTGLCLSACTGPSDCRMGYVCRRAPSGRTGCVPGM